MSSNVKTPINKKIPLELLIQTMRNSQNEITELRNIESPFTGDIIFSLIRNCPDAKIYCLVGISAKILTEWGRKFSFGRIILYIGKICNVKYFALQDSIEIIAFYGGFDSLTNLPKIHFC